MSSENKEGGIKSMRIITLKAVIDHLDILIKNVLVFTSEDMLLLNCCLQSIMQMWDLWLQESYLFTIQLFNLFKTKQQK